MNEGEGCWCVGNLPLFVFVNFFAFGALGLLSTSLTLYLLSSFPTFCDMSFSVHALPLDLIVNAGGKSRRMGQAKALLPMPPDATPLVVHIIARLSPLVVARGGKIIVVSDDALTMDVVARAVDDGIVPNVHRCGDLWPNGGALGGVASGLSLCNDWVMVVACDMPLVSAQLFEHLAAIAMTQPTLDAVIPVVANQPQPFHGLWHRRLLPQLEVCLRASELGVVAALQGQAVAWVCEETLGLGVDDLAFLNVNTPQEWADLQQLLQKENRPIA